MKLPPISKKYNWNYTVLAFLLPTTVMLVIFFIASVMPFGSYSTLYSDNYHQYYPFFRQFRQALRAGDGLLWTWSVGMGMDYLGLIAYYLASPLNLLSALLPESWVLPYFTLLMPIKLGLASGFFAILMKKLFDQDDLSLPLFGSCYALCAWALGYQWNIMWLDTFALLPLVALGTVLLLRERKYLLYTLTLALSIMANYYIGFFICIFVFLLFWCYEICRFRGLWQLLKDLFAIGCFTILAIGLTAVLSLPTLAALQDTYSSVNQFPENFELNIVASEAETAARNAWTAYKTAKEAGDSSLGLLLDALLCSLPPLLDGMGQVAGQVGGGQTPTYMDGLPNLYCGIFPLLLAMLFLLSKDVRLRDKLCSLFLLVLFMLSFLIRQLDYIWHGFHFTNQIPYRFSFLFSFVLLYMAYRAWLLRHSFPLWKVLTAAAMALGLLLLGRHDGSDALYWLFNLVFIGLYLICMVLSHSRWPLLQKALTDTRQAEGSVEIHMVRTRYSQRLRKWLSSFLAIAITMELLMHTVLFFSGFSIYDYDYPKNEDYSPSFFQKIQELDDGESLFYRTEVTHAQTLNDGALNGYYGISTFTSSANVATTEFMQCLGAAAYNSWNRYCYEESSPVANLFLNLKYLVERDRSTNGNAYFDPIYQQRDMTLLKNNAYLPLGFLAEAQLAETGFSTANHSFTFQNKLFRDATGVLPSVWTSVPSEDVTVTATGDVAVSQQNISGYTRFSTGAESGTLCYTYTISQEGYLCLDLNLGKHKNFTVLLNGTRLYDESYSLSQMLGVADVKPGDTVEVRITCAANLKDTSLTVKAAVLNEEVFRAGYEVLNASTWQLTDFSTQLISGTIHCNREGLLYTSVPQDGNWTAYVDGEKAEIILVGDCMVSIMLTEGSHTVELRYANRAFQLGVWITAGSALLLAGFTGLDFFLRRRKKTP